jgi:LDH2 family malate/lactate/ureidoglycolate dehydrogenase
VAEQDARVVADVLVAADLRGHESHGVARLDRFYVEPIERGRIAPRAQTVVVRETAATAVLDAGYGLGHPAAQRAMELCVAKAREAGTCVATVRHSNHYGIAGYYAMLALPHDMIGVSSTNALALVVPTGGRRPVFGSNPIAFAAPAGRHRPFVLDMATSMVPSGKVEVKARRGEPLPPGWAVDDSGRPTTEAQAVLDRLDRGLAGGLMPLGGVDAGHKGYGLGVMVDILCGILAGAGAGLTVYGDADERGRPADVGHLCVAIDPAAFGAVEEFKASMDAYIDALHAEAPAPGTERVRVAGEPEFETEEQRRRGGIPLHERVAEDLRALGRRVGVPTPF